MTKHENEEQAKENAAFTRATVEFAPENYEYSNKDSQPGMLDINTPRSVPSVVNNMRGAHLDKKIKTLKMTGIPVVEEGSGYAVLNLSNPDHFERFVRAFDFKPDDAKALRDFLKVPQKGRDAAG